jgi:hypothetical protein
MPMRVALRPRRSGACRARGAANGKVVGRIFKEYASRPELAWFWGLAYDYIEDRTPTYGHETTREAAMGTFKKSWQRE